jgi:hypothetical protein
MRATTFSGGAQAIVVILAILVPAILLSVQEYGFPVPQITFGYAMAEADAAGGALGVLAGNALPVAGMDGFNMLALALCLAAGMASFPHLVARFGAASGAGQARLTAAGRWWCGPRNRHRPGDCGLPACVLRGVGGVELASPAPGLRLRSGRMLTLSAARRRCQPPQSACCGADT